MAAEIRFVAFVLAPVSAIAVPLLLAFPRARRVGAFFALEYGPARRNAAEGARGRTVLTESRSIARRGSLPIVSRCRGGRAARSDLKGERRW